MALPLRTRAAVAAGQAVAGASRRAGWGEGSVIGGRVTLGLDHASLVHLARGRRVALVSGTNGKTTTTRLLAAALAGEAGVASNATGSNLLPGLVAALSSAPPGAAAALEVDEGLLLQASAMVSPEVVVLLNLSRDQLDRIGEVRRHAASWRQLLADRSSITAVANADDPLVAWAAGAARRTLWVGTGHQWREDSTACPACGERVRWAAEGPGWACSSCGLARPDPDAWVEDGALVLADGRHLPLVLQLPGRCNLANAAMAAAAAQVMGRDPERAVRAMAEVGTVAGRYQELVVEGVAVRLLLAKNPAGWAEALDLLRPPPLPVVVGINARVADGRDPSWLWDVPFERLAGRQVVATGDRGRDLAVRLRYADVPHVHVGGYREAVRAAGAIEVDLAANYTAFQDARRELGRVVAAPASGVR